MISSSVSRSLHPSIHLASFLFFIVQLLNVSNSLWPHGLQHARLLCPPLSPRICSNSCPSDAMQTPHSLSPSSALNLFQHQGLFHCLLFASGIHWSQSIFRGAINEGLYTGSGWEWVKVHGPEGREKFKVCLTSIAFPVISPKRLS